MKRLEIAELKNQLSFASFRRKRFAPARWRASSTDILLEERQGR